MSIEETKIVFTVIQRRATIRFELWFQKYYEMNQFALILICYIILLLFRRLLHPIRWNYPYKIN